MTVPKNLLEMIQDQVTVMRGIWSLATPCTRNTVTRGASFRLPSMRAAVIFHRVRSISRIRAIKHIPDPGARRRGGSSDGYVLHITFAPAD